jgi:serine/threonine protein kinase
MSEFSPDTLIRGLQDSYQIIARHAEGGFGITYRASRSSDQKPVLIKSLRLDRMRDWKSFELFEREAQVLAQLSHPNIPRYHEFFSYDGANPHAPSALSEATRGWSLILVQDFIEGKSLAALTAEKFLQTPKQAEELLRKLLGVLSYLHELLPPVVHRDINPRNVIIASSGEPFLVDFGAIQERLRAGAGMGSTNVGTFGYMPMEQAMGKSVPASDLYALGMTMLTALTHQDPSALPVDEQTGKVNLRLAAPNLSSGLFSSLSAMLEPAVGRRVASAKEALALLNGFARLQELSTDASSQSPVYAPSREEAPLIGVRKLNDYIFTAILYLGVTSGFLINIILFNSLSERELVEFSYLWFPLIPLGGMGRYALRHMHDKSSWVVAIFSWMLAFAALFFFFEGIFPSL